MKANASSLPSDAAARAARLSLAVTVLVVSVKLFAAVASRSVSVLAEALQSAVDVAVAWLLIKTIHLAQKPRDREHPYGHGKAQLLVGVLQMALILLSSAYVLFEAFDRLRNPRPLEVDWGIAAMTFAIVANLAVLSRLRSVSRHVASPALESEQAHLRADSVAAAGVLVGLALVAVTGAPALDSYVAAILTVVVVTLAIRNLMHFIHPLMDGSLPEAERSRLETVLRAHPDVCGYHNIRARTSGSERFIELHITLDDELSFVRAHEIAEGVEQQLSAAVGGAYVVVHYEPHVAEERHRAAEHQNEPET